MYGRQTRSAIAIISQLATAWDEPGTVPAADIAAERGLAPPSPSSSPSSRPRGS